MLIALAYLVICLEVSDHLKARRFEHARRHFGRAGRGAVVSAGGVGRQQGWSFAPPGGPGDYSAYHTVINWRWISLELATLAAGVVMLFGVQNYPSW